MEYFYRLEDIQLCKQITKIGNRDRLVRKHGKEIQEILEKYSTDSIINEYSKYPEFWLLTDEIKSDIVSEIINYSQDNSYGWSPDACFLLKQGFVKDQSSNQTKLLIKNEFQKERIEI